MQLAGGADRICRLLKACSVTDNGRPLDINTLSSFSCLRTRANASSTLVFIYTCIHAFIHTRTHTYMHTHIPTDKYIRTYIHACLHICIHVHVHTSGPSIKYVTLEVGEGSEV